MTTEIDAYLRDVAQRVDRLTAQRDALEIALTALLADLELLPDTVRYTLRTGIADARAALAQLEDQHGPTP